jgi:uncharacterized protein YceK
MKKTIVIVALVFAVVALMGCGTVTQPVAAGSATVGAKTGQSHGQIILGLFGNADASALTAAKNGGITKIATVDVEVKPMLGMAMWPAGMGLIVTYTTTVTGE